MTTTDNDLLPAVREVARLNFLFPRSLPCKLMYPILNPDLCGDGVITNLDDPDQGARLGFAMSTSAEA
jgi:hypothetical protein